MTTRKLIREDNLDALRKMQENSIDLVVTDPPYEMTNKMTITPKALLDLEIVDFYQGWKRKNGISVAEHKNLSDNHPILRKLLIGYGKSHSIAMRKYQEFLAIRMVEIHRVMKPGAAIYVQSRTQAAHYTKLMMDAIFGSENFYQEIIWNRPCAYESIFIRRTNQESILYYHKRGSFSDSPLGCTQEGDIGSGFWRTENLEREFPTDTPVAVYERMVERSMRMQAVLLDPFCGRGSALQAAENKEMSWIGIDVWPGAKLQLKRRLDSVEFEENL